MPVQLSILDFIEGERLRDEGILQSVTHTNEVHNNWSGQAYQYLCNWLKTVPVGYWFMTEDIRIKAEVNNAVPVPPSKRSWGGIIIRARNEKLIISNGIMPVKNSKAHCAFATQWIKI